MSEKVSPRLKSTVSPSFKVTEIIFDIVFHAAPDDNPSFESDPPVAST